MQTVGYRRNSDRRLASNRLPLGYRDSDLLLLQTVDCPGSPPVKLCERSVWTKGQEQR
jgi:hypothetical protein